jgi:hypothetical protein
MAKRNRLTNSSDENEIANVISGDNVFTIPYFQRPYKWKPDRLRRLEADILSIVDSGGEDTHFLGAIIVHGRRSNPSDPNIFEVIDGQQRLTTLYLYLAAIIKILCEEDEIDESISLYQKYLVIGRKTNLSSNFKLHSSKDDRAQLNAVFLDLVSDKAFKEKLGADFRPKPLSATGSDKGTLKNNYKAAIKFLKDQLETEGIERIRAIYRAILESMSVVQIDVNDPLNGPKIFDSLNSQQEPMTIGDLVRNEIFSKVVEEEPETIEQIDETHWQPFYHRFQKGSKNLFDAYFFPYGLTQDPNLRKSEVYNSLKKSWHKIESPTDIIDQLAQFQNAFVDLATGENSQNHPKIVARKLKNLHDLAAPTSTYPFLMQLSNSIAEGTTSEIVGGQVLDVVESFLVRRAICGHEPTGLHAVFKRLWNDCQGLPTADSVSTQIRSHKTVAWPDDSEVAQAVENRPLYNSKVTPYILLEYDRSLKGDQPLNIPWIEHVLPAKMSSEWQKVFSVEAHEKQKDLLANLIPLSDKMNIELSNGPYAKKRKSYEADSMFKSSRNFAKDHLAWTPASLQKRGKVLSKWAIERWAH